MQKKGVSIFINNVELIVDREAESFTKAFNCDADYVSDEIKKNIARFLNEDSPAEIILEYVRAGDFAFLFTLAGMGLLHSCENALSKAKIAVTKV